MMLQFFCWCFMMLQLFWWCFVRNIDMHVDI
jgi:hypothetical protein